MTRLMTKGIAVAMLAAPLGVLADDEGEIKYRQALMKSAAGHAGAIAQIAKGKVSHTDALQGHAHALLEVSKQVPSAFKNETRGDSRSKPVVWSDWPGFDGKAGDFERAALAVANAAKDGPGAVKAKLGDLFDSCKGCHKEYRTKKE